MKNKKILLAGTALVLGSLFVLPSTVSAYRGDANVQGPNYTEERHEAMEKAFDNNDYQAWKSLMSDRGRVTEVVNEGNFNRFAEAHKLSEEGKVEEAAAVRAELGLGLRNGSGSGQGRGQRWSQ